MAIDQGRLDEFLGKFVSDFGATFHAGMVVIGEKPGLYKALAKKPMTPKELASATRTDERYVREWLSSQAGECNVRDVVTRGGFTRFRHATQTPFNLVFEARP